MNQAWSGPKHSQADCVAWGKFWGDRYAKYPYVNILMGSDDLPSAVQQLDCLRGTSSRCRTVCIVLIRAYIRSRRETSRHAQSVVAI